MNAENERMFQENIVILNENFFRYLENSLRDMPAADYSGPVNLYLEHVRQLHELYGQKTSIPLAPAPPFALPLPSSTSVSPSFNSGTLSTLVPLVPAPSLIFGQKSPTMSNVGLGTSRTWDTGFHNTSNNWYSSSSMPPQPSAGKTILMRKWISNYPKGVYTTDGRAIFCQACQIEAPSQKFFTLNQHNDTAKHRANLEKFLKQEFLAASDLDPFAIELCNALIAANIPLNVLQNETFNKFLQKYCKRSIPCQKDLESVHLPRLYEQSFSRIRAELDGHFLYVSVDETTDKLGRVVGNLLVGKLDGMKSYNPYLVSVKVLENVDSNSISRFVNDGLVSLGVKADKVLLLVTDCASYMIKAAEHLRIFYRRLLHFTCSARGINRCDEIRGLFPDVDAFIAANKKVFKKSAYRRGKYHELLPDTPMLPIEPTLTRRVTWLQTAIFFADHFEEIKKVIESLDPTEAVCVEMSQKAFTNPHIAGQLAYIKSNFGILISSIKKLETRGLAIAEVITILLDVEIALENADGEVGKAVFQEFNKVLEKNPGYNKIRHIGLALSGENVKLDMPPNVISCYKYAPLTCVDVERSFSIYRTILEDNPNNFSPETLEKYLVCNGFSNL